MTPSIRSCSAKLRCGAASALLVASGLLSGTAIADPGLPKYLQEHYQMPCVPQCTLCHTTDQGGPGRLKSIDVGGSQRDGFGGTLEHAYQLVPSDPRTWQPALDADEKDKSDIDKDGVPDIVELEKGDDPNDPAPGASICIDNPSYGCVRVAPQGRIDNVASVATGATLVFGLALLRRRRKR